MPFGKALASIVMIMGYGILAVPTGIVSVELASVQRRSTGTRSCPDCGEEGHDRDAAFDGARVVYAKSWGARGHYGDPEAGAVAVQAHPEWIVDAPAMARTDAGLFMHCLPVRRGVVVTDDVLSGPASVVLEQGGARLDVQKATLCRAMGVTV